MCFCCWSNWTLFELKKSIIRHCSNLEKFWNTLDWMEDIRLGITEGHSTCDTWVRRGHCKGMHICHDYWIIRPIISYVARPFHHHHPFYMDDTIRFPRDIILVRYCMKCALPVEWDISCFCRHYYPDHTWCSHSSVPTLSFTSLGNTV